MDKFILVIDDVRTLRVDWDPSGESIEYARTLAEGKDALFRQEWSEVWLDHDLGEDETIQPLIYELLRMNAQGKPLIPVRTFIVHSMNPVGAARMVEDLDNAGYYVLRVYPKGTDRIS